MSLLLGERASSDVIRKGADKSVVEGIFEVDKNKKVKTYSYRKRTRRSSRINYPP